MKNELRAIWKAILLFVTIVVSSVLTGMAHAADIPVVRAMATASAPTPPSGSKIACMTGPNSPTPDGPSTTCPVIKYNNANFWPFSFVDNRMAINVVGYDYGNNRVSEKELKGPRYIYKVTVDSTAQTVTFWGQNNTKVTIPWSQLLGPAPVVAPMSTSTAPKPPTGNNVSCMTGPNSPTPDGPSTTCPVIKYNNAEFWPFSYTDNRMAINVVGYDGYGQVVSQKALSGPRYIYKVTVDSGNQTVTFWGQKDTRASLPWSQLVGPPPTVAPVATAEAPPVPSGTKIACMTGPNSPSPDGPSTTCPVTTYNGLHFWPYSYVDNKNAINVVGYDGSNNVISQQELTGTRYIWKVSVDSSNQTVTFWGQGTSKASMPWGLLK